MSKKEQNWVVVHRFDYTWISFADVDGITLEVLFSISAETKMFSPGTNPPFETETWRLMGPLLQQQQQVYL